MIKKVEALSYLFYPKKRSNFTNIIHEVLNSIHLIADRSEQLKDMAKTI